MIPSYKEELGKITSDRDSVFFVQKTAVRATRNGTELSIEELWHLRRAEIEQCTDVEHSRRAARGAAAVPAAADAAAAVRLWYFNAR